MSNSKILSILILMVTSVFLHAQDTTDVHRLRQMDYMRFMAGVDCQNDELSFLEQRICLNLEFQEADGKMNVLFVKLLEHTQSGEVRSRLKKEQDAWVLYRRVQCAEAAEGFKGHHSGMAYLNKMLELTQKRSMEIELMLW